MAPPNAGSGERPLGPSVTVAFQPAACGSAAARPGSPAVEEEAGAMVLYVAPPVEAEPVDAIPLSARPPAAAIGAPAPFAAAPIGAKKSKKPKRIATAEKAAAAGVPAERPEPEWLRPRFLLAELKLRADLPAHFIDEKVITRTDMDAHQNRLRLPTDGALNRLRPILTPEERAAANILDLDAPRDRPPKKQRRTDGGGEEAEPEKRKRKKGKVHGGLPVMAVGADGVRKLLLLSRWDSSHGIVIKGEGYQDFLRLCGFEEDDVIEIWALRQKQFRLFGEDVLKESPLYLLIFKTSKNAGE